MPLASFETLLYEEDHGVARVTLNRPDVHNAFNRKMQLELRDLWRSLRRQDGVRAVVVTGAGDEAFCTGIDRTETMSARQRGEKTSGSVSTPFMFDNPGADVGPKSCDLWKPVIAAVNGMACGGAFYVIGEADFVIAAESATFFDPHAAYGIASVFEPMHLLQKMPFHEVMRMSLVGIHERLSARRAYEIGLVSEVVPLEKLRDRAAWAAGVIASAPPLAIQGTLRAIWTGRELARPQALSMAYLYVMLGSNPASMEEGQKPFASKKGLQWTLR